MDLGNFDRRTLDQLLVRYERTVPPPHLSDLAVVQLFETVKREHRHKYFTLNNYRAMIAAENLPKKADKYAAIDTSHSGGFALYHPSQFYSAGTAGQDMLAKFIDGYGTNTNQEKPLKPSKPGRRNNPLAPDGRPIQGRPRKEWTGGRSTKKSVNARQPSKEALSAMKQNERTITPNPNEAEGISLGKRKRKLQELDTALRTPSIENNSLTNPSPILEQPEKRKRGLPRNGMRHSPNHTQADQCGLVTPAAAHSQHGEANSIVTEDPCQPATCNLNPLPSLFATTDNEERTPLISEHPVDLDHGNASSRAQDIQTRKRRRSISEQPAGQPLKKFREADVDLIQVPVETSAKPAHVARK